MPGGSQLGLQLGAHPELTSGLRALAYRVFFFLAVVFRNSSYCRVPK